MPQPNAQPPASTGQQLRYVAVDWSTYELHQGVLQATDNYTVTAGNRYLWRVWQVQGDQLTFVDSPQFSPPSGSTAQRYSVLEPYQLLQVV